MMVLGGLFFILFVLLIPGVIVYGLVSLTRKTLKKKEDPVLHMLRERLARGEITEEEYNRKRTLLQNNK